MAKNYEIEIEIAVAKIAAALLDDQDFIDQLTQRLQGTVRTALLKQQRSKPNLFGKTG